MENKMMMPANYNVLDEEEMTYIDGGDAITGAVSLVSSVAGLVMSGLYIFNYYKGMVATRNYIKAHKGEDTSTLVDGGMNTYANYMSASPINAVKGIAAGLASMSFLPITVLCMVTA